MKTTIHFALLLIPILLPFVAFAQNNNVINIENPSYEGYPSPSATAEGWFFCGSERETPPDIQPGSFGVKNEAKDGNTYAGIVTRDNGTFESLKFNLSEPTKKEQCYEWTFFISQSKDYESISRKTLRNVMFIYPVNIVIYGTKNKRNCEKLEVLVRYDSIYNVDKWTKLKVRFKTEKAYNSIVISVQSLDLSKPRNGHVLLDYFHPIIELDCEEKTSPTFNLPMKNDFLSFLDTLPSKEEKVKQLVEKIDFDFLYKHLYLEYQLYSISEKEYRYDNVYLNELIRLFPKNGDEQLILFLKKGKKKSIDNVSKESPTPIRINIHRIFVIDFIKNYIKQRSVKVNVNISEWSKSKNKKNKGSWVDWPNEKVNIFIKK
jgi:hypothetical protein